MTIELTTEAFERLRAEAQRQGKDEGNTPWEDVLRSIDASLVPAAERQTIRG